MQYFDANVFIHAALNDKDEGIAARQLLTKLISHKEQAVTSVLTLDEVAWNIKKYQGKAQMLNICRNYLAIPGILWVDATPEIIKKSLEIMEKYDLDPRDAIHAATCHNLGVEEIVSTDSEFDEIHAMNIRRVRLTKKEG